MADTLRAGVIGLGWAGQQHMKAYAADPRTELVGLAGMESDALARLGDEYGVEHRYADYADLIARGELDVISVCTPTSLHAPMSIAALDAGLHVLSEKPMAENATRAKEMVAAAERNDRVLDISFNHRRRGDVTEAKKLIEAGVLGRIYYAKAGWLRRSGIPGLGSWFTKKTLAGGGPMMDIGVHMLDIALHLMGEPEVKAVSGASYAEFGPRGRGAATGYAGTKTGSGDTSYEVEDLATAFVRLEGGSTGDPGLTSTLLLESSWASYIPEDQIYCTLYGTEGGATIGWSRPGGGDQSLEVWTQLAGVPADVRPAIGPSHGHDAAVADFLTTVGSGDWADHRGQVGLTRALIIDACYASADAGAEIVL
ncbi:putative dehydrogenase [Friedmanniella endophytica]|uniref:Putative dehydrogenase n=1 Tax=Microlunatus kandeliicorticis TaxID=1759536 RepID=A0A7W3IUP0_9ACTN|nr:Gfo/Idh/MocA family oxidoreductase [Microlunatus kandeliicorticis]MBA8795604.1 putative dehydrogenase [Microlunatus kandeliicorticis]